MVNLPYAIIFDLNVEVINVFSCVFFLPENRIFWREKKKQRKLFFLKQDESGTHVFYSVIE